VPLWAADTQPAAAVPPGGVAAPAPAPAAPAPARPAPGWWRRNWWGLVLLPVVLVAAMVPFASDAYEQFWTSQPRTPVAGTPGGWVAYGGARIRIVDLVAVADPRTSSGRPVLLPAQVRAWRVRLEFTTARPESIGGCSISLEASNGARYAANPAELSDLLLFTLCTPDSSLATPPPVYQVVAYFVLPAGVRPSAVRITVPTQLPRFARLAPP
jgi:hypothetical protein